MIKFAGEKPVVFEILLIIASFLLSLVFMIPFQAIIGWPTEPAGAMGRIIAAVILFLVFIRGFELKKQFSGFILMLPALLFALWNVINCFITGGEIAAPDVEVFILGLAPGFFEEVVFRSVFINNMKTKGMKPLTMMLLSGVIFGLMHITNAIAQPLPQVLLQTCYSMVVGITFAAIYIRSGDLVSVIIAHSAIDITNRIFIGGQKTPGFAFVLFWVMLIAEAAYAFYLVVRSKANTN